MRDYLGGVASITWMALVHAPFVLVPFAPVAGVLALLGWSIEHTPGLEPARPRPRRDAWLPSVATFAMLALAPPFFQPQTGERAARLPWPAWMMIGLLAVALVMAVRTWWRTEPAERPTTLLLVQLWLATSTALVTAMAVTPGAALGAL